MTKVNKNPSKRERNKLEKRERIRRAAWSLFTEVGYEAATTKAVAERAGVATGTVFLYARDKPDLLFMVFEERLGRTMEDAFASLPRGGTLLDRLMHVFGRFFSMYGENPAVAAEFVKALPGATGPNAQAVHGLTMGFLGRIAGMVGEAIEAGEVGSHVPPMRAAANIFALYFGALMSWLSGMVDLSAALDPGLRDALELQIRGFRPE